MTLRAEMRERDDDWTVPFIAAMHRGAAARAPPVVEAVGAGSVTRMLDVGGGSGAYAIAFAQANPKLTAEVLDLPTVLPITQTHIDEAGLTQRVTTRSGDLRSDDFGSGYDLVLLSSICHMLGAEGNRDLLKRAAKALAPGGRVVIQDFILEPDRTRPRQAVLFAINMLVGTEAGSTYTAEEYAAWLGAAGLGAVRRVRLGGPADLMVGRAAVARPPALRGRAPGGEYPGRRRPGSAQTVRRRRAIPRIVRPKPRSDSIAGSGTPTPPPPPEQPAELAHSTSTLSRPI